MGIAIHKGLYFVWKKQTHISPWKGRKYTPNYKSEQFESIKKKTQKNPIPEIILL